MTTKSIFDTIEAKGPNTKSDSVTKTLVCKMKSSNKKNEVLQSAIDEWQEMAGHMADLMPSYDEEQWGLKLRKDQRLKRDFPKSNLYAAVRNEAAFKVCESFDSWSSNGKDGERPQFGNDDYIRLRGDYVKISRDNGKYSVQLGVKSGQKVWWGLTTGDYQKEILDEIVDGELKSGSAEVHYNDGEPSVHLNYTINVGVYKKPELNRWLGVDLGESKMWVASPVEDGEPIGAAVFDQKSDEFREYRKRMSDETNRLTENGDLNAVKVRRQRRNYTDTMTHTASHEIVQLAVDYKPCGIALEDLTNYRKSAEDPIHDWPYAQLQEKIIYKANERGIPVRKVNPRGTSYECWKCGTDEYAERINRDTLICTECGDERHADVNAAINIGIKSC